MSRHGSHVSALQSYYGDRELRLKLPVLKRWQAGFLSNSESLYAYQEVLD